jgi:hypothetical protein
MYVGFRFCVFNAAEIAAKPAAEIAAEIGFCLYNSCTNHCTAQSSTQIVAKIAAETMANLKFINEKCYHWMLKEGMMNECFFSWTPVTAFRTAIEQKVLQLFNSPWILIRITFVLLHDSGPVRKRSDI